MEKMVAIVKYIDEDYSHKPVKKYHIRFADDLCNWEPWDRMDNTCINFETNVPVFGIEDLDDIFDDRIEFGYAKCLYFNGKEWENDAVFTESFYCALCEAMNDQIGYSGDDPEIDSIALCKSFY